MSFRNRPVLDRKHRPRWQDELRTQRLIVGGFAGAIAVALGIFAATAWSSHYDAHLLQVAAVDDTSFTVDQQRDRMNIMGSELQATGVDIQSQLGGTRDPIINQQISFIQNEINALVAGSTDSLVLGRILELEAASRGIALSDAEVTAEVTRRQTLRARVLVSVITIPALPDGAKASDTPTDADWATAKAKITDIYSLLQAGASFADTAKDKSKDATASTGGLIGWVSDGDSQFGTYFTEAKDATKGDLLAPAKDDQGYHILKVSAVLADRPNKLLIDLLAASGINDAQYRAYLRTDLLRSKFRDYFTTRVETAYQPQRHLAQIYIAADTGVPVPMRRVRHFLAQPIPGQSDQSTATDAQWAAALARAEAFRTEALKPNADWTTLAATSDDPGSKSKGGDLGWFDPASSNFVQEFQDAIAQLTKNEISKPIKTQFGYHVIEVIDQRINAEDQAARLLEAVTADPASFEKLAREQSEDASTASKGGDLGWVIPYQLEAFRNDAAFAMTEPDQISDLIRTSTGYYILKLIESKDLAWVAPDTLKSVRNTGVSRWLDALRAEHAVWVDPAYATAPATG
jgi:parvulin-like peptidyl-prolyl isomerase